MKKELSRKGVIDRNTVEKDESRGGGRGEGEVKGWGFGGRGQTNKHDSAGTEAKTGRGEDINKIVGSLRTGNR
eukprot:748807-Hanusia_phi.AAC.2